MAGPLEEFTIKEVALALTEMKNKKSPGPTLDMIKFGDCGLAGLFEVFNNSETLSSPL